MKFFRNLVPALLLTLLLGFAVQSVNEVKALDGECYNGVKHSVRPAGPGKTKNVMTGKFMDLHGFAIEDPNTGDPLSVLPNLAKALKNGRTKYIFKLTPSPSIIYLGCDASTATWEDWTGLGADSGRAATGTLKSRFNQTAVTATTLGFDGTLDTAILINGGFTIELEFFIHMHCAVFSKHAVEIEESPGSFELVAFEEYNYQGSPVPSEGIPVEPGLATITVTSPSIPSGMKRVGVFCTDDAGNTDFNRFTELSLGDDLPSALRTDGIYGQMRQFGIE